MPGHEPAPVLALLLVSALHAHLLALHADPQLVRAVVRGVQGHLQLVIVLPHTDDLTVSLPEEVHLAEEVVAAQAGQHPPPGEHPALLPPTAVVHHLRYSMMPTVTKLSVLRLGNNLLWTTDTRNERFNHLFRFSKLDGILNS